MDKTSDSLSADFCPYRGLAPYTAEYADYFFGRTRDQKTIVSNLYASTLTILYGASGVGKSSVLLAGVLPQLRNVARLAVVVFRTWQDDKFEVALKTKLIEAINMSAGRTVTIDPALPLDDLLLQCTIALRGRVFVIFDQFEEYFLYDPASMRDRFDAEFACTVNREEVRAHFLLSMREDGLSKLDRFQGRIPNLLSNMLRLEHLTHRDAEDAIRKPVEDVYNHRSPGNEHPMHIEGELVEALLNDPGLTGEEEVHSPLLATGPRIEAPFLQLVLTRLWAEERRANCPMLRLATLRRLGGAKQIVSTHLQQVMLKLSKPERAIAALLFRYLVTPSGTKVAYTIPDLAGLAELAPARVEPVVNRLTSQDLRTLRTVAPAAGEPPRYEIFHDVLAASISKWRTDYAAAARRKRLSIRFFLIFLTLLTAAFATYWLIYLPWAKQQPWCDLQNLATARRHPLKGDFATIGRPAQGLQFENQVNLLPNYVSRMHLMISRRLVVLDLRSRMGTTVNAEFLPYGIGKTLEEGDIIVMGGIAPFRVHVSGSVPVRPARGLAESPPAWARGLLIDGKAKSIIYLHTGTCFLSLDERKRLAVEESKTDSTFLTIQDGKGIRVEQRRTPVDLVATYKKGDYEYEDVKLEPGGQYPDLLGITLRYDDVPFQIVPIVPRLEPEDQPDNPSKTRTK
jgi:hypothetical protein